MDQDGWFSIYVSLLECNWVILSPCQGFYWSKLRQSNEEAACLMGITLPKTNIAPENRPSNNPFSGAMFVSGRVRDEMPWAKWTLDCLLVHSNHCQRNMFGKVRGYILPPRFNELIPEIAMFEKIHIFQTIILVSIRSISLLIFIW